MRPRPVVGRRGGNRALRRRRCEPGGECGHAQTGRPPGISGAVIDLSAQTTERDTSAVQFDDDALGRDDGLFLRPDLSLAALRARQEMRVRPHAGPRAPERSQQRRTNVPLGKEGYEEWTRGTETDVRDILYYHRVRNIRAKDRSPVIPPRAPRGRRKTVCAGALGDPRKPLRFRDPARGLLTGRQPRPPLGSAFSPLGR